MCKITQRRVMEKEPHLDFNPLVTLREGGRVKKWIAAISSLKASHDTLI